MMKNLAMIALAGIALATGPASAQSQAISPGVQNADKAARATIRTVYGAAGYMVCKSRCAKPAAKAGEAIYSGAQKASNAGAKSIQRFGRSIRERGNR